MATLALESVVVQGEQGERVLDSIDLTCPDGALTALVGRTGAGTTTVLRVFAGTQAIDGGRVLFGGVDVATRRPRERDVAMVDQRATVFSHMTVRDNVAAALDPQRLTREEVDRRVEAEMRALGLADRATAWPNRLSAGDRQRLAVARAIVRRPVAFLLDNPFAAIDERERVRLRHEVGELQRALGITTVLASHDPQEAMSVADHLAVLDAGRVLQAGPPQSCYDAPRTTTVAELLSARGITFVDAPVEAAALRLGDGAHAQRLPLRGASAHAVRGHSRVLVGLRPEALRAVHPDTARPHAARPEGGSPDMPVLVATVTSLRGVGVDRDVIARLEPDGPEVRVTADEVVRDGDGVLLEVRQERALAFDLAGTLLATLA